MNRWNYHKNIVVLLYKALESKIIKNYLQNSNNFSSMLKINKKNEIFRQNLHKKIYFKLILKILPLFLSQSKNKQVCKYIQNLYPRVFTQNSCTKIRSICILTGRSRSVYRAFKMSRLKLREYASQGYFTGIAKAS